MHTIHLAIYKVEKERKKKIYFLGYLLETMYRKCLKKVKKLAFCFFNKSLHL